MSTSRFWNPSSLQQGAGALGQQRVALDGHHLAREQRQHAGLIAGAGAHFEHALVALQAQRLAS